MKKEKNIIIYVLIIIISMFQIYLLHSFGNLYLKQLIWNIFCLGIIIVGQKVNINTLFKYSLPFYIINALLLIYVLIFSLPINGAKAWISLGGISFQPSESMKIFLALLYTKLNYLKKTKNNFSDIFYLFLVIILFFIPSFLVFLEPDTGAIIIYLIILVVAIFSSNINKWYKIALISLGLLIIIAFGIGYFAFPNFMIKILGNNFFYRLSRIFSFTKKSSYQANQGLIAIGSAKLLGSNNIFIPEAQTDFILAYAISRLGMLVGIIILLFYLILDIVLLRKCSNYFGKMFIYSFLYQQIHCIFMNIGLVPIMGIPLPFLSYGGTNTIIYGIFLAISLNKTRVRI